MTSKKEIQAPSLEQAIAEAAQVMGIAESDVHYRLIDEGRRGVLGIGQRDVRIEIEVAAQPPKAVPRAKAGIAPAANVLTGDPPTGADAPRRKSGARPDGKRGGGDEQSREGRPRRERKRGGRGRRGRGGRNARQDGAAVEQRPAAAEAGEGGAPSAEGQQDSGGESRNNRRRGSGRGSRSDRGRGRRRERAASSESGPPMEIAPETLESFRATVQKMMDLAGLELTVATEPTPSGVRIELSGDDLERVTDQDTEFQFGLQFLLNRMSRRAFPDVGRIQIGQEGRRSARDEELIAEIREVAGQVARTGVAKTLHPMNPYERRLVHLTVREFEGLETSSEGDGFLKTVTVCRD